MKKPRMMAAVLGIGTLHLLACAPTSDDDGKDSGDDEGETEGDVEGDIEGDDDTRPTAVAFDALVEASLDAITQVHEVEAGEEVFIISDAGVGITIPAGCLASGSAPATGPAELTFIEIYDRATMVVTNKPTVADDGGVLKPLLSGGEYFLEVSQGGVPLTLDCPAVLQIPVDLTGGADEDMILFEGTINERGDLVWTEAPLVDGEQAVTVSPRPVPIGPIGAPQTVYTVLNTSFGWRNCDRFNDDPREKTTIYARLPEGFTDLNSRTFLSVVGVDNLLSGLYYYDETTSTVQASFVPIGLEMHLIFVTSDGEEWRYAIQTTTVDTAEQIFVIDETAMMSTDEAGLLAAIGNLE